MRHSLEAHASSISEPDFLLTPDASNARRGDRTADGGGQSRQPHQHGVTPLNLFMGKGGEGYCLTEASNADAVCQAHASQGLPLEKGDVHEVTSLV